MKLATKIGDFYAYTNDALKCIDYAYECGFKYLDFSFFTPAIEEMGLLEDNYKEYLDKIIKKCNDLNVKFVQAHAPMGKPITKNEDYNGYMKALYRSIECSAYLGIENLVVHSGHQRGILKEENFIKNKEFFLPVLDFAQNLGVKILTENLNLMKCPNEWYWTETVEDVKELVEYINHPNLYVCYDIGHANMQPVPQHEQLKVLGELIKAIHVQDNNAGADYHLPPLVGTTNYDSVMKGLIDIGFNGYFTLEASNIFMNKDFKTPFEENRLALLPIEFRLKGEKLMYEVAKYILQTYNCFEE